MGIPLHSKIRRHLRSALNFTLGKLFTPRQKTGKIDPEKIKKILLIRINYRIGNIIFTTPLIRALEKKLPDAKIDMLVGASFTKPIIEKMPNVHEVYPVPRSLIKQPIAFYRFIRMLNQKRYDLIISPATGSVSANIAAFLIQAPLKLGIFRPDTWLPFNITVPADEKTLHEALKPLAVMEAFAGTPHRYNRFLDIALTPKEREEGKKLLQEKITKGEKKYIVGLFRDARNDKKIADTWWKTYLHEMQKTAPETAFIDILAPGQSPLSEEIPTISSKNLRNLAKIFSALDAFICADTGPMHLASASMTPTIALFNATDPAYYGPLGEKDKTLQINEMTTEEIAAACREHIDRVV